jgi:hypothetical protein
LCDRKDGEIVKAKIDSQLLPVNFENFQGMDVTNEVNDGREIYLVVVPDSKNANRRALNTAVALEAQNLKGTNRKADI